MSRPRLIAVAAFLALTTLCAVGCVDPKAEAQRLELREKLIEAESQIESLQTEQAALRAANDQQKQLILELRDLGSKRLEHLFTVDKIELGRFTGPANLDDTPGQDGVRVRIGTLDAAGTPIKRAGTVTIQLYDLAGDEPKLIGKRIVGVEKIGETWSGHFGTYHFAIDCPWDTPPSTKDMTIRVTFIEYLTGSAFTAQKDVQVDLPQKPEDDKEN